MDTDVLKIYDPFSATALNVFSQLGFSDVKIGSITECGKNLNTPDVVVVIGFTGDLRGNAIFAMGEDCAKSIASTMMMGTPVETFDEMAQSAVGELGNMLSANTCIEFASKGITADISTPTIMHGVFSTKASYDPVWRIEISISGMPFYIFVSCEQA